MHSSVRFLDLAAAHAEIQEDIEAAVLRVTRRGWYVLGEEGEAFEAMFARFVGVKHCVGVANGLEALRLALVAMGVGAGDEVIVPSNTYIATWLAVTHTGAIPVPVEPDELTYNITAAAVAGALNRRTKAIVAVHLYGQPADCDGIRAVAAERGVRILEDAAQAHGARLRGRRAGALGDAAGWSFYPTKNLGALGDAGAVTTDDDDLAKAVRVLRNYGSRERYVSERAGFNSRLDEVQAAVLRVKLRHLDAWNVRRTDVAARYRAALEGTGLLLPSVPEWAEPVWHLYVVRSARRDALQRRLRELGVETLVHYPVPPHLQTAYAHMGFGAEDLPIAERLGAEVLSLPLAPYLTEKAQDVVIDAIWQAVRA